MGYSAGFSDGRWSISAITFTFAVSAKYRGTSTDHEVQTVDPEKAGATASAAETARAIAKQYSGYSDYAKMIASEMRSANWFLIILLLQERVTRAVMATRGS